MTEHTDELKRVRQVYNTIYRPDPANRDYIWHPRNPVSVYYRQARERALIALFNDCEIYLEETRALDIGCGNGYWLRFLVSLGARPENVHGLDLMPYRIERARELSPPQVDLHIGDAGALPYPDRSFDLVSQFTVFSSILDDHLRWRIADEMARVLKPGGCVLWYDMRRANTTTTRGIEKPEIERLFSACAVFELRRLHPPGAARIARRSLFLCELWDRIPGPKKTHYLGLLQKVR